MTNYAQPKGIEDWPEDLRRRYLEAMRLRQLELENQAVGGTAPTIPMATDEERNLLMQQERLQSLLKQASTEGSMQEVLLFL